MKNLLTKKGLNLSLLGIFSIVLIIISTLILIFSILNFIQNKPETNVVESNEFLILILSLLLVFLSVIFGQNLFNSKPDQNKLSKISKHTDNQRVIAGYYKSRGFSRILIYFWPAFFYLAVINYITFGLATGAGGKGLFVFILFFTVIVLIAVISLFRRYMLLSLFLVLYKDSFVLRNNLTTYYFTRSIVERIEYVLVSGKFLYIVFVTKDKQRIKIDLTYFSKSEKTEIQEQINKIEDIEKLTIKVQRRSRVDRF